MEHTAATDTAAPIWVGGGRWRSVAVGGGRWRSVAGGGGRRRSAARDSARAHVAGRLNSEVASSGVSEATGSPAVADLVRRAAEEQPGLTIPAGFEDFLRSKLDPALPVDKMAAGDLLLVFAACHADARAVAKFEEHCIAPIGRIVSHLRLDPEALDELKQRVRTKLLVAEVGRAPRLLDYAGRARLRSWVGVVATREALSTLRRQSGAPAGDDALMELAAPSVGPELDYLKRHYREAFAEAFATALGELGPRARNALRHHYVHGLTIDEVGSIYGIHRSSAARRIAKARDELLAGTRRHLVLKLNVGRTEVESIMRMIESRIDVSLRGALGGGPHAEPDASGDDDP